VAIVGIPKGMLAAGVKEINANNTVVWQNGLPVGNVTGLTFVGEDSEYIRFRVQPGSWTFQAFSQTTSANAPVVLYSDCSYGGNAVALPVGRYNLSDLIALGIPNDSLSSLRVLNGYRAILYWDANFSGNSLVKTADTWCLVDDNWNDAMSSIVIEAAPTLYVLKK
jgi:hypothetical protein